MTEDEIVAFVKDELPGAAVVIASDANAAPPVASGWIFFFYDPDDQETARRFPFATIVGTDVPGFDESSRLHRQGVFRLNICVGQELVEKVATAAAPDALDTPVRHPVYGPQGWVSILNPDASWPIARDLVVEAHRRAVGRHRD